MRWVSGMHMRNAIFSETPGTAPAVDCDHVRQVRGVLDAAEAEPGASGEGLREQRAVQGGQMQEWSRLLSGE